MRSGWADKPVLPLVLVAALPGFSWAARVASVTAALLCCSLIAVHVIRHGWAQFLIDVNIDEPPGARERRVAAWRASRYSESTEEIAEAGALRLTSATYRHGLAGRHLRRAVVAFLPILILGQDSTSGRARMTVAVVIVVELVSWLRARALGDGLPRRHELAAAATVRAAVVIGLVLANMVFVYDDLGYSPGVEPPPARLETDLLFTVGWPSMVAIALWVGTMVSDSAWTLLHVQQSRAGHELAPWWVLDSISTTARYWAFLYLGLAVYDLVETAVDDPSTSISGWLGYADGVLQVGNDWYTLAGISLLALAVADRGRMLDPAFSVAAHVRRSLYESTDQTYLALHSKLKQELDEAVQSLEGGHAHARWGEARAAARRAQVALASTMRALQPGAEDVNDVEAVLQILAPKMDTTTKWRVEDRAGDLRAMAATDRALLHVALHDLTRNAIQAGATGSTVSVDRTASPTGDQVRIRVTCDCSSNPTDDQALRGLAPLRRRAQQKAGGLRFVGHDPHATEVWWNLSNV